MKLNESPRVPSVADQRSIAQFLYDTFKATAQKVNQIGDGRLAGSDFVASVKPTTGTFAQGDFVRNSAPAELGVVMAKYVVIGWVCTVGGTPGTLLDCRVFTGN